MWEGGSIRLSLRLLIAFHLHINLLVISIYIKSYRLTIRHLKDCLSHPLLMCIDSCVYGLTKFVYSYPSKPMDLCSTSSTCPRHPFVH